MDTWQLPASMAHWKTKKWAQGTAPIKSTFHHDFSRYGILIKFYICPWMFKYWKIFMSFKTPVLVTVKYRCRTIPHSFRQFLNGMLWDTIWWITVVKANIYICKQVFFCSLKFIFAQIPNSFPSLNRSCNKGRLKNYSDANPSPTWPTYSLESNAYHVRPLCRKYWILTHVECWWFPWVHFSISILACASVELTMLSFTS